MNALEKLAEYFRGFPGIGPRQAKRFVYYLLTRDRAFLEEFSALVLEVKKETSLCPECFRYYNGGGPLCTLCKDERDNSLLLVVEKDVDVESIEKSGAYNGRYFVLGGRIPLLEKKSPRRVRTKELLDRVKKLSESNQLQEIVLAFSVDADGENTSTQIEKLLIPLKEKRKFTITFLGRGLSTGSELEYADSDTLQYALKNRALKT